MLVWVLSSCAAAPRLQPTLVFSPPFPSACAGEPTALDQTLCIARRKVQRARDRKDIVWLLCERQKVTALESLRTERDLWPSTYAAHRVEIDAKVDRLRVEIEQCIGDIEAMHAGPVVVDTD